MRVKTIEVFGVDPLQMPMSNIEYNEKTQTAKILIPGYKGKDRWPVGENDLHAETIQLIDEYEESCVHSLYPPSIEGFMLWMGTVKFKRGKS